MKEKISNKELYNRTLGFGWRRLLLYVRGTVAAIVVIVAFCLLDKLIGILFGDPAISFISWMGIALGIFAFFFIAILPIEPMRASHTAIMTEAILYNNIPQPCVEEGQKIALRTFPVMSFLILFGEGFRALADLVRIKDASKRSDWGPKVRSMVLFLLSGLIPYLGPCMTSWAFCHQDKDTKEGLIEGGHIFFKNLKHLIGFMIVNIFAVFLATVAAVIGLGSLILNLIESNQTLLNAGRFLLEISDEYREMRINPAEAVVLTLVSLIIVYVLWVFVRPICTIRILRRFYGSMDEETLNELKSDHQ